MYTDKSLKIKCEKLMQDICKQLEQIIMEKDDEDRGFITAKDFINDFATEDFIKKYQSQTSLCEKRGEAVDAKTKSEGF